MDWNNDGRKDLVLGEYNGNIRVYLNTGTDAAPAFSGYILIQTGGYTFDATSYSQPEIVDWNEDGKKDILCGDSAGRVHLLVNSGTDAAPAFAGSSLLSAGGATLDAGSYSRPVVADWDGDGRKDLLVSHSGGGVWLYTNTGTDQAPAFQGRVAIEAGGGALQAGSYARAEVADFDSDGLADVLCGNGGGNVLYYRCAPGGAATEFTLGAIASPQTSGVPFSLTVTALDAYGNCATQFNGSAALSASAPTGVTDATVVIAEIRTGSGDAVEFANVSSAPVDVGGWEVYIYDTVSWPGHLSVFTVPAGVVCGAGEAFVVIEYGSTGGVWPTFYTGANINWTQSGLAAVMLRDTSGAIRDFVTVVGDPALISAPIAVPESEWSGNPVSAQLNAANTQQRVGSMDSDSSADWCEDTDSVGAVNGGLSLPFAGMADIPVSPHDLSAFVNGVWTGMVTVHEAAVDARLQVEAAGGMMGTSGLFDVESRLFELTVASAHGMCVPPPGVHTFAGGAVVACSVTQAVVQAGLARYVCGGWTGAGSVTGGTGTGTVITIESDSAIAWTWTTNYWLDTETQGSGTVDVADGWVPALSNVTIEATADAYHHLEAWSGDTNGCGIAGMRLALCMLAPRTIVASFAPNVAPMGAPQWWLAAYGLTNGGFALAELSDTDGDGMAAWEEWLAGTVPTNAASVLTMRGLTLEAAAPASVLTWQSVSGRVYSVERSDDLVLSGFAAVASNLPATPPLNAYTDSVGRAGAAFYRVRVAAPSE